MQINEGMKKLEEKVMDLLLTGDHPALHILYEQWKKSAIKEVELTGAGFFISYEIQEGAPVLPGKPSFPFGDVEAELRGMKYPTGYVLFVENGKLKTLEGYITDDAWPDKTELIKVYYFGGGKRDWKKLEEDIGKSLNGVKS